MDDLSSLLGLAGLASFGLTTLPKNEKLLSRRIRDSVRAFEHIGDEEPRGESYFFVLEDLASNRVIGTCGIVSKVGGFQPFYAYRVETNVFESRVLGIQKEIQTLHLVLEHNGPCEIGSLFLHPEFRRSDTGRALSLARFLFMAEFPSLFDATVIAEIRGVVDDLGRSAFWDAVGRHFFDMEYPKADVLSVTNKEFIGELMPRHPIYVPMLPPAAREVIGVAHPESVRAQQILAAEGFRFSGMVDIFEAGPVVACSRERIRAVAESVREPLVRIADRPASERPDHVVAKGGATFRACASWVGRLDEGIELARQTADALGIRVGDVVRTVRLRPLAGSQ